MIDTLHFAPSGAGGPPLIPVIAQHAHTGEVLMLGYASREAVRRSLDEDRLWFYSRSRRRLWLKGETSGNLLRLVELVADCDGDALLARVLPAGPTCHRGTRSCFPAAPTLRALADVIERRRAGTAAGSPPDGSYTARLLADSNLRLKKLGEEATELALACANAERDPAAVAEEAADLLYHALVACAAADVAAEDVLAVLERRRGPGSGAAASSVAAADSNSSSGSGSGSGSGSD